MIKRAKEYMPDSYAYSPVRLVGGFICVDFHLGCHGCSYCLNRRDSNLDGILNTGVHVDYRDRGITASSILSLLDNARIYTEARVPIRIGHLTDWHFEIDDTDDFCRAIPSYYPCVLMTRFPLSLKQRSLVSVYPNLLAHVTLTPEAPGLERSPVHPLEVIESTQSLPHGSIVYMLRPLAKGATDAARQLIDALPAGSVIAMHGLSTDNIDSAAHMESMTPSEIVALKEYARKQGHRIVSYFGCALRSRLHLPFFKYPEAYTQDAEGCEECPNFEICHRASESDRSKHLIQAAEGIGITVNNCDIATDTIAIQTETPCARADEVYLSEKLCATVRLSPVAHGSNSAFMSIAPSILERWQDVKLIDTVMLKEWSNRITVDADIAASK